jgi:hypothetical protein
MDTALRSLDFDYITPSGNISYNCQVFLFRESTAENIEDLNTGIESRDNNWVSSVALAADGMTTAQLNVVRASGKVSLQLSNGNYATYKERDGCWFKPVNITDQVYDWQAAANQNIGNCVLFTARTYVNRNGGSSNAAPSQAVPALTTEDQYYALGGASDGGAWHLNSIAAKTLGGPLYFAVDFGRRAGGDGTLRRRDFSCFLFEETVEADFLLLHIIRSDTGAFNNQQIGALYIVDENNALVSIGIAAGTSINVNTTYRFNFTKRMIKGVACISHATSTTSGQSSFYIRQFTAGLKDPSANATYANTARPEWTKAVVIPNVESNLLLGVQGKTVPVLMCNVGTPESAAELKINNQSQYFIPSNFFVDGQKLLEVDA